MRRIEVEKALLLAAAIILAACPASAERLDLSSPIATFAPTELGGIRKIVRYEVAHPNQTEIDYLLLAERSDKPGATPVAIQVEEVNGEIVKLADDFWPDCTLARVAIFRQGREVVLMKASRTDDVQHVMAGSLAQPGAMRTQIYRRQEGGGTGESSPLFKADGPPSISKPACTDEEVQQVLASAALTAFKSSSR